MVNILEIPVENVYIDDEITHKQIKERYSAFFKKSI